MENKYYSVRFLSDENSVNWFQLTFYGGLENHYYSIIISDNKDDIYHCVSVENQNWYNYDPNKIFQYNIKLLQFDGETIQLVDETNFNIKNHNFNIILKSESEKEIKIWKFYLWLLQLKMNVKFNIVVNEDLEQNDGDYFEISKNAYDNYLKKTDTPLTDDYSSITIITSMFNVLDDNSDILNHTWLKD